MNVSDSMKMSFSKSLNLIKTRKETIYLIIFVVALVAFEAFNYSTTDVALTDLLGELRFVGFRWATLLSIAFCGIDFAGIALLLAPQEENDQSRSAWFMLGAWILAATMNALLTWWGVVLAIQSHSVMSTSVVDERFVTRTVPVFIALMVWTIRILLVGSLSKQSKSLSRSNQGVAVPSGSRRELRQAQSRAAHPAQNSRSVPASFSSANQNQTSSTRRGYRPEPTYIPMQEEAAFHSLRSSGSDTRHT